MQTIIIPTTKQKQVIDITEKINEHLASLTIPSGVCSSFLMHTTAALTTADLDPGTDLDMLDAFATMMPKLNYRHPHNPAHVPDHILSAMIGTSLMLPFEDKKLLLGQWQRVVLIELDGSRKRSIIVNILAPTH